MSEPGEGPSLSSGQALNPARLRRLLGEVLARAEGELFRALVQLLSQREGPMADEANPYRVLGLDPGSSDEMVRLAYRHLARRHHPDRGGGHEAMARLNRAYEEIAKQRGWQ